MMLRKRSLLILVPALAASVVFTAFTGFARAEETKSDTFRHLNLWTSVLERIRENYVEEVDEEELIEAAIRGMLSSLDPHSGYMGPESYRENQLQTRGEYGGVGMEVIIDRGVLKVVAPMDGTPASRAGMMSGDYITHVDEEAIVGMTVMEAVDLLRGPVDSNVTITVVRDGVDKPFKVDLTREIIKITAVRHSIERGNIGYVRLTTFNNEKLSRDLRKTMRSIRDEVGDDLGGIILDLRDNPGGLLDQAIEVTDLFLERGEIVSMRGRNKENYERWNASPGDEARGLPIIILVNAGTASASEIVTGALQDHRRATVVGVTTFGKGVVQSLIPLGPDSALRLTTARYYTPSGASIQAVGIAPDIQVSQLSLTVEQAARKPRRESDLKGHIVNENGDDADNVDASDDGVDDASDGTTEDETQTETTEKPPELLDGDGPEDYQLDYALNLLEGIIRTARQRQAIN